MYYKISLFFISAYLVLSPYILLPGLGFYDSKRVLQLSLFFILGIFTSISLYKSWPDYDKHYFSKQFNTGKPAIVFITLLAGTGIISILSGENVEYALLEYLFFFLLLFGIAILIPTDKKAHYRLGKIALLTAVFYSGLYLIIFFGNYFSSFHDELIPLWPDRLSFSIIVEGIEYKGKEVIYFVHRRFFNHTQTWTIPILTGLLLYYVNKKPKDQIIHVLLFLLIAFWWMLIFASGARGSFVSLIASLLIIVMVFGKTIIPYIKYSLGSVAAGCIFYLILFRILTTDQAPMIRTSDSGRLQMWERAVDLWLQEPFFGIGPLHYAKIIDSSPYFAHPHNFYIQFLAEWGIIAFISLVVLLILAGRFVINSYSAINRNPANQLIYIAFVWSMAAALIHASLSGVMHTPMSQVWFIIIGAWLSGYTRYQKSSDSFKIWPYYSIRILFIILLATVLFLTVSDIPNLQNGYTEYMNEYPGTSFYSRFWEQGLFD